MESNTITRETLVNAVNEARNAVTPTYRPAPLPYLQNPDKKPMTEAEKRWLSWNFLVRSKVKGQYSGTVPEKVKAKRRAKNKVAKASRKANR